MGPPHLWLVLGPSPDLQLCMECSSIFSTGEGCRGLFSPPLLFATNSLRDKGNEGWQPENRCRHLPTKRAMWFTLASGCTEDSEYEHQEDH